MCHAPRDARPNARHGIRGRAPSCAAYRVWESPMPPPDHAPALAAARAGA